MRTQYFTPSFAVLIAACVTSTPAPPVPPIRETPVTTRPVAVQEAFREARTIGQTATEDITVVPGQTPLVTMGKMDLLVVPLLIDGSKSHVIKVRSRVVKRENGSFTLFYPILSYVDQDFRVYQTIKPKYEFAFSENVLTNEFEIPQGVERILIRTDEEFFRGEFVGITSMGERSISGAQGAARALGGIVGLASGIPGGFNVGAGLGDTLGVSVLHAANSKETVNDFKFGEVGIINIEIR
jgi:hypothetical protein